MAEQVATLPEIPTEDEKSPLYWEDAEKGLKLLNGDSLALLRSGILKPGSVDLIVTSPPYNIGTKYNGYEDKLTSEEYLGWLVHVLDELKTVMSPQASLFLNISGKPTDPWLPFEVLALLRSRFKLQNTFHWVKALSYGKGAAAVSLGHYKPLGGARFVNDCHEYIFHVTKSGKVPLDRKGPLAVPYKDSSNAIRWKNGSAGVRCRGNVWVLPYKTITSRVKERPHPATFPVALPEYCMQIHGVENIRLALDPFSGIGTTLLAGKNLGVPTVGIELDPYYCKVTKTVLESKAAH